MKLHNNEYLAVYFTKSQKIAASSRYKDDIVTMQWFQRSDNVIFSGIDIVLNAIKKHCSNWSKLEIWSLPEGVVINNQQSVLVINGCYSDFAFMEGLIDGILGMQCTVATNARNIVKATENVPVIYMNDRNSYPETQKYDGYAAYVGGIRYFTSYAQVALIPKNDPTVKVIGSVPHSLIQLYRGDANSLLVDYKKLYPSEPLVLLVDYSNDVTTVAIKAAKAHPELCAVRIDTSPYLIDNSLKNKDIPQEAIRGVNKHLIKLLRKKLDTNGFSHVKIIISSGLNSTTIAELRSAKAPVDFYGVGLAFKKNYINFTGDSVLINGKHEAKTARKLYNTSKLKKIITTEISGTDGFIKRPKNS